MNATSPDLHLQKGIASRALVNKGGSTIQDDLNKNYTNGITEGQVAKSVAGTLSCKQVYHITMMKKKSGGPKVKQRVTLESVIFQILINL